MTTRENDLVAVLNEKDALIERLQKELGEAREMISLIKGAHVASAESAFDDLHELRAKTIEQCALIAEKFAEVTGKLDGGMKSTAAAGMWNIAKAIRAIDGGGK